MTLVSNNRVHNSQSGFYHNNRDRLPSFLLSYDRTEAITLLIDFGSWIPADKNKHSNCILPYRAYRENASLCNDGTHCLCCIRFLYDPIIGMKIIAIGILVIIAISLWFRRTEGFENAPTHNNQVSVLSQVYSGTSGGKRPFADGVGDMPESDQILTNFYSLGCRFTGYIGPTNDSYYDPDIAVQTAVAAGCRTFVLEIDYINDCDTAGKKYFPRLVVRDVRGRLIENEQGIKDKCNSAEYSMIRDTCEKINYYAFSSSCQNGSDPVILVLYFLRQPPGAYDDDVVLNYFSNVAKMLDPLSTHFLRDEPTGTYYRQMQEGQLLMNKLGSYNNKVIVCSNANTSGFRGKSYNVTDDLDYMTNLRLSYTQTSLGITDNTAGSTFGILETAEDFMIVPNDRQSSVINETKLKWTICFSRDPFVSVPKKTYDTITKTYGVHCVPILLHDTTANKYMFTDSTFKIHSFIPKPAELRYKKPPTVVPAEPSKTTDAKGGMLRAPTVQGV